MGNDMWHVALKPGTTEMHDVFLVNLDVYDLETICCLLSTDHLKGKDLVTERGSYLFMYGGEYERPYPSVMIWRFEPAEEGYIIKDMRQEDGWIIKYVWREWLMPEETDAVYVPPERFLLMMKE